MTTESTMPTADPGALLAQAMEAARGVLAGVGPAQLDLPSPCTEWTVKDLANHVVRGAHTIADMFGGATWDALSKYDGDLVGADALSAYAGAADAAQEAVAQPGAMEQLVHFARGETPGAVFASLMFTDILIHCWDLAVATGQDATLPPSLVEACYAMTLPRKGQFPAPAFAPDRGVTDDADTQTKLLGMLGRDAAWTP